ncbi:MAG: hypothetical protein AAGD47_00710 [Pseudomonadota bacterium]
MRRLWRALALMAGAGFPWPGWRRDAVCVAARRAILRRWPLGLRPLAWLGMALSWPLASLIFAVAIARNASGGPSGLWIAAWRAALARNVPPREFVHYQLWRPSALSRAWLFEREVSALLAERTTAQTARLIADKAGFADWLAGHGVPVVPTLCELPKGDFVTKPRRGVRGAGIIAWTRDGDGYRGRPAFGPGAPVKTGKAALDQTIRRDDLLIQPCVAPDPVLGSPMVARVVTARAAGKARLVCALVQTPAPADFCSQRGAFRLVDVETGRIRPPGPGQRTHPLYPAPRFAAEGAVLPGWDRGDRASSGRASGAARGGAGGRLGCDLWCRGAAGARREHGFRPAVVPA